MGNLFAYHWKSVFCHDRIDEDAQEARERLMKVSVKPSGSAFSQNCLALEPKFDLQIIVPAYNVEAYLEQCIFSIILQKTKYNIQIQIVDDGSTDRTGQIADAFTDPRIRVIHQKNQGAAAARNTALKYLNARYIMFVDADDWIPAGCIDALLDVALEKDAQIVQGGYQHQDGDYISPGLEYPQLERVTDPAQLYGFPVGKVYKRELWQHISFPEGFWYEDTVLSFLLFPQITEAWLIPETVYVYRKNINGATFTGRHNVKCLDTYWITEELMAERVKLKLPADERYQQRFFRQILLNSQRIDNLPEQNKRDVFLLTCDLYNRFFSNAKVCVRYRQLQKAVCLRDFGLFGLCLRYRAVLFHK